MKAFCTSCGAPMEADDRHCRRCGRLQSGPMLVRAVGQPEEPAAELRPPAPGPRAPRRPPLSLTPGRFDLRVALLGVLAVILVIFAVGLAIGRLTSSGSGRTAAGQPRAQQPPAVVTPTPSPSPTPTPTSAAHFTNVSWNIPGSHCSTANGCPATGVFRNQGPGRGEGTARFDVASQDGGTVYASCTAPIPATDPGATAEASCSANSPELANLWHQNPSALITLKVTAS
ncbi:MAG: hypothetical protein DLM67_07430 [Candidatus Nephthysia bennettiae]|uniref:Zinc ribbon domain-containing protein n=2 Tax=Candidatus Nephthysia bennettiae TaxID=3127016 RepID=A0A934NDZ4_9BACT|nr:hypothetical protein [Candidatus Dormibacteraeota bacterium]PZR97711.1 MAG: hypothetical protein DLM67_07430 [Candidatus Dormibacteraeota bacterium]